MAISFPFSIFSFPILMRLYNNGVKIFGMEGVLCRRFAVLEDKMVYTTRGKCSIYRASRAGVFFLKKFLRAKIVPKNVYRLCVTC